MKGCVWKAAQQLKDDYPGLKGLLDMYAEERSFVEKGLIETDIMEILVEIFYYQYLLLEGKD